MKISTVSIFISVTLLLNGCVSTSSQLTPVTPEDITGVVFNDINSNGRRDSLEPGIGGVRVSNGTDIVFTDGKGRYALDV